MSYINQIKSEIISYVFSRKTENGGFSFAQTTPVSLDDTYYALSILNQLNYNAFNDIKTEKYLESLFGNINKINNVHKLFQILFSLNLMGINLQTKNTKNLLFNYFDKIIKEIETSFNKTELLTGAINFDSKAIKSIIDDLYYFILIKRILKINYEFNDDHIKKIKSFLNLLNLNNIKIKIYVSLLYKLLYLLNIFKIHFNHNNLSKYLIDNQNNDGGFGFYPKTTSFLENVYFSLISLNLINSKPNKIDQCRNYIINCKCKGSGFGRAHNTVSTLDSTYFAICSLKLIDNIDNIDFNNIEKILS